MDSKVPIARRDILGDEVQFTVPWVVCRSHFYRRLLLRIANSDGTVGNASLSGHGFYAFTQARGLSQVRGHGERSIRVLHYSHVLGGFSGGINDLRKLRLPRNATGSMHFHEDPQSSVIYAPFLATVFRALIEAIWNTSDNRGDSEKCAEHTHGNSMNMFNCRWLDCP